LYKLFAKEATFLVVTNPAATTCKVKVTTQIKSTTFQEKVTTTQVKATAFQVKVTANL